ncbi:MAG: SPFH domain-containing protein [Pseudomonadota bacterium]
MDLSGFGLFGLILVGLAIATLYATVKIVPQGYKYTVERFGRYTKTLSPGLHILIPGVERVAYRMNLKEQVMDIPGQDIITRDNAMVRVDGVNFFQVLDAAKAAYEVDDLVQSIVNLTMTNIRTVMGSMDLDELLSNRDQINARLLEVVDGATESWGVKVTRIEIKDIEPPRDLVDAMASQMKAERIKRARILEAEGKREADILSSEGEKRSQILEAEGRREAAFREAEGRERAAQAEAKATEMVSAAIAAGNTQAINYFVANNYVRALEALAKAPNQKVIMMPLEASSVIGSIAGLTEITREAFNPGSGGGANGGSRAGNGRPAAAPSQQMRSASAPRSNGVASSGSSRIPQTGDGADDNPWS